MIQHPIPPFYDEASQVLILGSFPSVKSREQKFFYGHPQNRFWKVLASLFDQEPPLTIEDKKELLRKNCIALWDVIACCEIEGSMDQSIRNPRPNDLETVLKNSAVQRIFVNGQTAKKLYDRLIYPQIKIEATVLPSTSPANAAWSLERLIDAWHIIKK